MNLELDVFENKDNHHQVVNNIFHHPSRWLICGGSGSGKTNLLNNLLLKFYRKKNGSPFFDEYYILSPNALSDFEPLKNDSALFGRLKVTMEFDVEKIMKLVHQDADKKKTKIVIYDDLASEFKNDKRAKLLNRMWFIARHFNITLIVTSQAYRMIPRSIRLNCSDICLFAFSNKKELIEIETELGSHFLSGEELIKVMTEIASKPYTFLYRNIKGEFFENFARRIEKNT